MLVLLVLLIAWSSVSTMTSQAAVAAFRRACHLQRQSHGGATTKTAMEQQRQQSRKVGRIGVVMLLLCSAWLMMKAGFAGDNLILSPARADGVTRKRVVNLVRLPWCAKFNSRSARLSRVCMCVARGFAGEHEQAVSAL